VYIHLYTRFCSSAIPRFIMGKFIKPGKVVIVLAGRYAGRKAVVVKAFDDGTNEHKFPHALVAGIERYPLKVSARMGQKRILKRSKVKPFIKFINLNHLMPTRYSLSDVEPLKASVKPESVKKAGDGRVEAKKAIKKQFEERYLSKAKQTGGSSYFFAKLRF